MSGLVFIFALVTSYLPVFIEIFENRKLHPFFESITASPNSSFAIVLALVISLLPDVILKSLIAGIILQALGGFILDIIPFLIFMFLVAILGFFIINLALTFSLFTASPVLHLFAAFLVSLFIVFSSGWIIPLDYFPPPLSSFFSYLPTAQLLEGGRQILFHHEFTLFTWFIPLVVSMIWLVLNSVFFRKVNTL